MTTARYPFAQMGILGSLGSLGGRGTGDGIGTGGLPSFKTSAITLNGIADFISKTGDLNGLPASASNLLFFSWVKHRFFTNNYQLYFGCYGNFQAVGRTSSTVLNVPNMFFLDDSGSGYIDATGSLTIPANVWNLLAISLDISNMASPIIQIMLNNTLDTSVINDSALASNKFMLTTYNNWNVGAGDGGIYPLGGDIAMSYINYSNTFFDLSITANKRKLITAAGKPVNPGADGSLVTGAAPQVFMIQNFGDNVAENFAINYGNGGMLPLIFFPVGSPTIAPTSPSD